MSLYQINLASSKLLTEKIKSLRVEHIKWLKFFNKQIICKIYDKNFDVTHTACNFGQWYYSVEDEYLVNNADFKLLGGHHQDLHEKASHILTKHFNGEAILEVEYDSLI